MMRSAAALLALAVADSAPLTTDNRTAAPCTNTYGPRLHTIEYRNRRFLLAVPDGLVSLRDFCSA